MTRAALVSLSIFLFIQSATAQDPGAAVAKTYVERAARLMGGLDRLNAIKTVRLEYRGHTNLLDESERPDGPWIVSYENDTEIRDYQHAAFRADRTHWFLGEPEGVRSSVTVAQGIAQGNAGAKHFPMSLSDVDDAEESATFSPERIIPLALKANDLHAEPDATLHGEPYHVVAFSLRDVPVRILFNAYTGLPGVVEWKHSYPNSMFWRPWGDVLNHSEFTLYTILPGGLRLPLQWDLERNAQPYHSRTILKIQINPDIPPETFRIEPDIQSTFQRRASMTAAAWLGTPSQLLERNDSLIQYAGDFNCALIRQSDGVVVLEATSNSAHTDELLKEAARRFPGLPIKAVITTSDAWAHFGGVREAVARGIPIYATDLNEHVLTEYVRAPFRQSPDSLSLHPKAPSFHWISAKTELGSGPNRIEMYPIRNATGERMMMVYFPEHRLLYSSDLVQKLEDGSFFMPEYLKEMQDAVDREHLRVDSIFGMHIGLTPWADVQKSLNASWPLAAAK